MCCSYNEGGEGQMNDLICYSWVGGIMIGTIIGSNMVLDEVSRAGPRNVVITGSTRGLGKALAIRIAETLKKGSVIAEEQLANAAALSRCSLDWQKQRKKEVQMSILEWSSTINSSTYKNFYLPKFANIYM
ncbi:putative chlorophyll(ide) b reductase NYC1, chloroplastic [Artemisia annua]|uniref:Putative chlorophyll(Ide) b reductase NYC1, chloroplastic n=1 Tax=Artemisia annua TaxID=35608 RepID=A0A2U1K8K7_ARTAN|nr:putative chlorophyll(ide) b reductase NYC1, chloroplastic [Artemisia annua]